MDVDGEFFALKTHDRNGIAKIQLIETHRIGDSSDDTCDGIGLASDGSPVFYRLIEDSGSRDIPADSMMHVFEPESVSAGAQCPHDPAFDQSHDR